MKIAITDTCISLSEKGQVYTLLEKPVLPDYSNVTTRPYFCYCVAKSETIWERFCFCMENLQGFYPDDPYLGCYALLLRHLYPLLLSSSQAKSAAAYGSSADCGAYRVIQDFMTFLQKGNALTALAQSPFSFTALSRGSCHALIYRLDTCPALAAVCDAITKIRPGGLLLLYTIKDTLPAELTDLCARAQRDHFGACTLYALTVDEALADFAGANGTEAFLLSRSAEVEKRVNDLHGLIQTMLSGATLPDDAYFISAAVLQQIEEILLSLYDYLEDDELPVRANALKESILNYYAGIDRNGDLTSYIEKMTQTSKNFFAAVDREFHH